MEEDILLKDIEGGGSRSSSRSPRPASTLLMSPSTDISLVRGSTGSVLSQHKSKPREQEPNTFASGGFSKTCPSPLKLSGGAGDGSHAADTGAGSLNGLAATYGSFHPDPHVVTADSLLSNIMMSGGSGKLHPAPSLHSSTAGEFGSSCASARLSASGSMHSSLGEGGGSTGADDQRVKKAMPRFMSDHQQPFAIAFAVFINLIDACTFGTILFPPLLKQFSSVGISSFLFSTALVQLVFNLMSDFRMGLGTSMAENLPFLNAMANSVVATVVKEGGEAADAIPTVLVVYALSTVLTGLVFYLTGFAKLGQLLNFFPRHVIIGMIAGFGVFLSMCSLEIATGLSVSQLPIREALGSLFSAKYVWLWVTVVLLQLGLKALESFQAAEMITPLYMMVVPLGFYAVLHLTGTSVEEARAADWLFPRPPPTNFLDMWTLFDFGNINWASVTDQLSTMTSLSLFLLVLVPIRIPTLALTTDENCDFNKEIMAHGVANIISGAAGSVHNYLSYSNSVFYYNCGGRGAFSQWVIFAVTAGMFFLGPGLILYIPRCVAGCVMLTLGVDLLKDALFESRGKLDKFEYGSVVLIAVVIACQGFVWGIAAGAFLAQATFVLQASRTQVVRATFSGDTVRSNTLHSDHQKEQLSDSLKQVHVVQLQGNVFFASIQQVVEAVSDVLHGTSAPRLPFSSPGAEREQEDKPCYVVLDFALVTTLDSTAVAALIKLEESLLAEWSPPVEIIFAGMSPTTMAHIDAMRKGGESQPDEGEEQGGPKAEAGKERERVLDGSGARAMDRRGSTFHADVNQALTRVEHQLIRDSERASSPASLAQREIKKVLAQGRATHEDPHHFSDSLSCTALVHKMLKELCPADTPAAALSLLATNMRPKRYLVSNVLWTQGSPPDSCCLLLVGRLVVQEGDSVRQTIMPGNLAGELGLLSGEPHTRSVVAAESAVVAMLTKDTLSDLSTRDPRVLVALQAVALKTAHQRTRHCSALHSVHSPAGG